MPIYHHPLFSSLASCSIFLPRPSFSPTTAAEPPDPPPPFSPPRWLDSLQICPCPSNPRSPAAHSSPLSPLLLPHSRRSFSPLPPLVLPTDAPVQLGLAQYSDAKEILHENQDGETSEKEKSWKNNKKDKHASSKENKLERTVPEE